MTRALPHNPSAEAAVIGAVLLTAGRALLDVGGDLESQDFYHPANAALWEGVLTLDAASKPVDAVTVEEQLRSTGNWDKLNAVGGQKYLGDLLCSVATTSNVGYYARIVSTKAARRRWIVAATEVAAQGYGDVDDQEFLEQAETKLLELTLRRQQTGPKKLRQVMHDLTKSIGYRWEHRDEVTGVPSGFGDLDEKTHGWQDGDLIIVAARPSMGKTLFAGNLLMAAGCPALAFELEMSDEAIGERLLAADGNIEADRIRSGRLSQVDWASMASATSRLAEAPVWIDDTGSPTLMEIRSKARRWRAQEAKEGKALVIVDYLQLVRSPSKSRDHNREREMSEVSRGLKALAKDLKCPVIALAQLNRDLERRPDKRPMLSDLRESGAIEQDADVITFIYRDEAYHDGKGCEAACERCQEHKGIAEIIIGKQRKGPTGTVRLAWQPEYSRFRPTPQNWRNE